MTTGGDYAAVSTADALVFLTGQASGPATIVEVDGLPFVVETVGPNGNFLIPARAGEPFTLRFLAADTGVLVGTTSGTAPGTGTTNLGNPLGTGTGVLTLVVDPTADAIV